jgi:hypothetical protein
MFTDDPIADVAISDYRFQIPDCRLTQHFLRPGQVHQLRQAPGFRADHFSSEWGHRVVAPAVVFGFRGCPGIVINLDNKTRRHEAAQRAVQRAWAKLDVSPGAFFDVLGDAISMACRVLQREQDVKYRGGQRQK